MAKFFIVHLSDLHIGSRVTQTLNRLIESSTLYMTKCIKDITKSLRSNI